MTLGLSVTASGPIFHAGGAAPTSFQQGGVVASPALFALDGASVEFVRTIHDSVAELARLGTERLFQQGQSKPGGVFLSVEEAREHHSRPSTGFWRAHLVQTVGFLNATIENSAVYNAWLEGVGSRNESTRFKGYALFRKTQTYLDEQVQPVTERFAADAVRRLNA